MTPQARIIVSLVAFLSWLLVLRLLGRQRLGIDHASLWSVVLAAIFLCGIFPELTDIPRAVTGSYDPLSGLWFVAHVFVGCLLVYFSSQISILKRQVTRLAQELALAGIERREAGPGTAGAQPDAPGRPPSGT